MNKTQIVKEIIGKKLIPFGFKYYKKVNFVGLLCEKLPVLKDIIILR